MEQVPDTFSSLFIGYTAIWVILSVYILSLVCKVRKLEEKSKQ